MASAPALPANSMMVVDPIAIHSAASGCRPRRWRNVMSRKFKTTTSSHLKLSSDRPRQVCSGSQGKDLSRVHDVVRIDRTLDLAHQIERRPEFVFEIIHLALADAMLAGTGAVHGDRPQGQAVAERLHARHIVRVVAIEQHRDVEIAVADMAEDGPEQAALCKV